MDILANEYNSRDYNEVSTSHYEKKKKHKYTSK